MSLPAVQDNTLFEPITKDGLEDRSNGAGTAMFAGAVKDALNSVGQVAVRRAVLAFDIAGSIPPGSTIDSVELHLRCTKVKVSTSFGVSLHALTSDWGEGASNTGNSQKGRGDTGAYIWGSTPGLVADVQGWLDDPS